MFLSSFTRLGNSTCLYVTTRMLHNSPPKRYQPRLMCKFAVGSVDGVNNVSIGNFWPTFQNMSFVLRKLVCDAGRIANLFFARSSAAGLYFPCLALTSNQFCFVSVHRDIIMRIITILSHVVRMRSILFKCIKLQNPTI